MKFQRLPVVYGLLFFFIQATVTSAYACYVENSQYFAETSEVINGQESEAPSERVFLQCLRDIKTYQSARAHKPSERQFSLREVQDWLGASYFTAMDASLTGVPASLHLTSLLFPHQSIPIYKLNKTYRI